MNIFIDVSKEIIQYVDVFRLSGLSPFAGEDDLETLQNVGRCDWEFAEEAFSNVSPEAKDFIRRLLIRRPQ
jgi:myosin-light-chain kinase